MRQRYLHPADIVVALALAITRNQPLTVVAGLAGRSLGEAHNAIRRLRASGLVDPDQRIVWREPLLRFIDAGVRVAFPPSIGGETIGIKTAFVPRTSSDGALSQPLDRPETAEFVWPAAAGQTRGQALIPLHPRVAAIAADNRELWELLALVDLVRVGGAREHREAMESLRSRLTGSGPTGG